MRLTLLWLIAALSILLFSALWARATTHYAGEWDNVDPAVRSWFRNLKSPHGVPCCSIADGHKTLEEWRGQNEYWIPNPLAVQDASAPGWIQVPPEAVVYDAKNPTGEAVVWYTMQTPGEVFIRCFVPGGGV